MKDLTTYRTSAGRWWPVAFLSAILVWPGTVPSARADNDDDDKESRPKPVKHLSILQPNSRPFGHSYGEWAAMWSQWALSIPEEINPNTDPTGQHCHLNQQGPVWFLAGTAGEGAVRHCTVPAGKALFFPVITTFWTTTCVGEPRTKDSIRPLVAPFIDAAHGLAVEIDGIPVSNLQRYRAESPLFCTRLDLFGVDEPSDLAAFCPPGVAYDANCTHDLLPGEHFGTTEGFGPTMADGYWLMLAPLKPGKHTIHFIAKSGDFSFLGVTYHLNVVHPPRVFRPGSKPYGMSYGDWVVKWWQWAFSIPADRNPLTDTTGEFADENQHGKVWFLAGTFGSEAERTITIPKGKAIFLPVFNWIFGSGVFDCDPTVPNVECDVDALSAAAAANTEAADILEVTIDGAPVQNLRNFRARSSAPFPITYPENSVTGVAAGTYFPQVADGYWLMLPPLSVGEHEIRTRVRAPGTIFGLIEYEVVYHLTVVRDRKHHDDDKDDDHDDDDD